MWWAYLLLILIHFQCIIGFENCTRLSDPCAACGRMFLISFHFSHHVCYRELYNATSRRTCCKDFTNYCPITKLYTGIPQPYSDDNRKKSLSRYRTIEVTYTVTDDMETDEFYQDPISKKACPLPYSYNTFRFLKVFPVNFTINRTTPLPRCANNSECPNGTYCGYSVNPSFVPFNLSKKERIEQMDRSMESGFCYESTVFYEDLYYKYCFFFDFFFSETIELARESTEVGYGGCNFDRQYLCYNDEMCYIFNASKKIILRNAFKGGHSLPYHGICAYAYVCKPPLTKGWLGKGKYLCNTTDDCEHKGKLYKVECTKFSYRESINATMCCYNPKKCAFGVPVMPTVDCKTTQDCNLLPDGNISTEAWTNWCDDQGFCCYDAQNLTNGLCPDGVIFAFNERKCEMATKVDVKSGICTAQPNAICRYGYCCSGLETINGSTILAKGLYITNVDCDLMEAVPPNYKFAYCNGSRIVIIGSHDAYGREFVRNDSNISCEINENCFKHGLTYCVRENRDELYCYRDPRIREHNCMYVKSEKETNISINWHLISIAFVSLFGAIFVALFCIIKRRKIKQILRRMLRFENFQWFGSRKKCDSTKIL